MSKRPGKAPGQRSLRVGEELRHALAQILERGDIRDPDVAGHAITVTEVRISPDMRNATIYVVPLGGSDTVTVLAGLKRVRAYLRHEAARLVTLRHMPELWFEADTSFDYASHIDTILHRPEVARDLEAAAIDDEENPGLEEGRDDGA
ncbi:MAG: 30S ribosome-binding factor RbfA [Rhodospirillales bacterium]|nr:30S ribosome-binding factor RbfA [Rhodospirillales bacterium]